MNKRDIVEVGLVLIGVGWVVQTLAGMAEIYATNLRSLPYDEFPIAWLLICSAHIVAGIALAKTAPWWASRLVKSAEGASFQLGDQALFAGCSLLGLWLLAASVPMLIMLAYQKISGSLSDDQFAQYQTPQVIRSMTSFIFGLGLVAKAEAISDWLKGGGVQRFLQSMTSFKSRS